MIKIFLTRQVQITVLILLASGIMQFSYAQYSIKNLSKKHEAYYDSLKNTPYDRKFPILGDKVYKRGFDIPFPFGIMVNNFYGKQDITISDIKVGIIEGDSVRGPVDMSKVIVFDNVNAKAYNINVRADMYIFPFLNVYVLGAYMPLASTAVSLAKPVQISTNPKQSGWGYGFGIMGAGGVGPVWLQADINFTWADMELLENKVFTKVAGFRIGHTFPIKSGPEKNFAIWIGTMGIFLNNATKGKIPLDDLLPDIPPEKVDEIKNSLNDWYTGLTPPQQKVVDRIIAKLDDGHNGGSTANTYITYEMNKAVSQPWAGLIGVQYQFSKKWQLRVESNCVGNRFSTMLSVNYRFLGFKKTMSK